MSGGARLWNGERPYESTGFRVSVCPYLYCGWRENVGVTPRSSRFGSTTHAGIGNGLGINASVNYQINDSLNFPKLQNKGTGSAHSRNPRRGASGRVVTRRGEARRGEAGGGGGARVWHTSPHVTPTHTSGGMLHLISWCTSLPTSHVGLNSH